MASDTSYKDKCPRCSAVMPAGEGDTLCPACLMSGALKPGDGEDATLSMSPGESLSFSGPSEFPYEFGDYRLLGLLGRGGMGTVYEAEQLATGRRVALKMLGQQLDSPEMRQRFLREGRLAAGVNHPNSVYIFGSEEIEGLPVITMEIARGGTLKDKLKERGPLPLVEAVDAILDVISGLESAFSGGVLHRDIKPSNCFVCPDGLVKVGDFGLSVSTLAKTDTFVTAHGMIMGTPAYAAPEQLRGDTLDLRADIYSVGATLFTLLTNRPPFEGDNAVQVVANAVNQKPKSLGEFRDDIPPELERVIIRCLAKEPEGRYPDYPTLRNVLLPFSSRVPEPASMKLRAAAGWIDYLSAFLVPYVALMFSVGAVEFHVLPFVDRTLYAGRFLLICYGLGFLYFAIAEGFWGAGLGKRLKGLRVVRTDEGRPGFVRAFVRIVIPILCIEAIRVPFLLATISARDMSEWTGTHALLHIGVSNVVPWIAVLLTMRARRENGFTTVWDRITGTRVVVTPKGMVRGAVEQTVTAEEEGPAQSIGPFRVTKALIPEKWLVGSDPLLRRPVWLLRWTAPGPSPLRRSLARQGRLRWLQKVEVADATWDAFEATPGMPFSRLVADGTTVPWSRLRHWLYDLASELWAATGDHTLPAVLSLDHIWITAQGQAMLLDDPWPDVVAPAEGISVSELAGQQRFLSAVAACVESTSLPLHARGVLQNLAASKFEKLSFLTGILRGLQDRPAEVNRGIRAGSLFMMPAYVCTMSFVGYYQDEVIQDWGGLVAEPFLFCIMVVLGIIALVQLCEFPFRTIVSHAIYRLAVIDAKGERAGIGKLYLRWVIVWLPLLLLMAWAGLLLREERLTPAFFVALIALLLWICGAIYAVIHPNRGIQDRLVGTWVVRQ